MLYQPIEGLTLASHLEDGYYWYAFCLLHNRWGINHRCKTNNERCHNCGSRHWYPQYEQGIDGNWYDFWQCSACGHQSDPV